MSETIEALVGRVRELEGESEDVLLGAARHLLPLLAARLEEAISFARYCEEARLFLAGKEQR